MADRSARSQICTPPCRGVLGSPVPAVEARGRESESESERRSHRKEEVTGSTPEDQSNGDRTPTGGPFQSARCAERKQRRTKERRNKKKEEGRRSRTYALETCRVRRAVLDAMDAVSTTIGHSPLNYEIPAAFRMPKRGPSTVTPGLCQGHSDRSRLVMHCRRAAAKAAAWAKST